MLDQYRYKEFGEIEEVKPVLPWKFFVFSLFFALVVVGLYFFANNFYLVKLQGELQSTKKNIAQLSKQIKEEDKENAIIFFSQIKNLEKLISSHDYPTNLFPFLENHLKPEISLRSIAYQSKDNSLSIVGTAKTERDVVEQVSVFENDENIKSIKLGPITKNRKEGVDFSISIEFQPDFFTSYESIGE